MSGTIRKTPNNIFTASPQHVGQTRWTFFVVVESSWAVKFDSHGGTIFLSSVSSNRKCIVLTWRAFKRHWEPRHLFQIHFKGVRKKIRVRFYDTMSKCLSQRWKSFKLSYFSNPQIVTIKLKKMWWHKMHYKFHSHTFTVITSSAVFFNLLESKGFCLAFLIFNAIWDNQRHSHSDTSSYCS